VCVEYIFKTTRGEKNSIVLHARKEFVVSILLTTSSESDFSSVCFQSFILFVPMSAAEQVRLVSVNMYDFGGENIFERYLYLALRRSRFKRGSV
jgi:hypothetical protein